MTDLGPPAHDLPDVSPSDAPLQVLVPEVLAGLPGVVAGFSLRHGGVSESTFRSLNLGLSAGDDPELVLENRRRLFRHAGLDPDRIAVAGQVHGDRVKLIDEAGLFPGFDALVTVRRDITLCITAADCAVILLADPDADVIGAVHSGWRGTTASIVPKTLRAMQALGASPASFRAYISPCISADYFEVGPEVAEQFDPAYVIHHHPRPHIDLKAAIRDQLLASGIRPAHIETSPRCTFAETRDFFSYRAEGKTGRMMGFISIKKG